MHAWVYVAQLINPFISFVLKFNPELVLVSCGFDAAQGDPLVCGIHTHTLHKLQLLLIVCVCVCVC